MAWSTPEHDRAKVNKAGNCLIAEADAAMEHDDVLNIINNWRSSHSFPLRSFKMTLLTRAKHADSKAIVVQRLKRLQSIEAKLRRFPEMKLTQIQDIGGCRAVVTNMRRIERLSSQYERSRSKNPTARHEFVKEKDYIHDPKDDGYRSLHLIYRYRSTSKKHKLFNGLKIEIQLRTRLQHAWATAVETVAVFTKQALKSGGGEEKWRRFFILMSASIALREKQPPVPGVPANEQTLVKELRKAAIALNVRTLLGGWSYALTLLPPENTKNAAAILIFLDVEALKVSTNGYTLDQLPKANEDYLAYEKQSKTIPGSQAVLVAANSVRTLRAAYPNFYADAGEFLNALEFAIRQT